MFLHFWLLEADYLVGTGCVQTFVKHFTLVKLVMLVGVARQSWLPLIISIGHSLIVGRSGTHHLIPLLILLHLLLRRQLLVTTRAQTPLTQRQQHLRRRRHRHNHCMIPCPQPRIDLLNIAQALLLPNFFVLYRAGCIAGPRPHLLRPGRGALCGA